MKIAVSSIKKLFKNSLFLVIILVNNTYSNDNPLLNPGFVDALSDKISLLKVGIDNLSDPEKLQRFSMLNRATVLASRIPQAILLQNEKDTKERFKVVKKQVDSLIKSIWLDANLMTTLDGMHVTNETEACAKRIINKARKNFLDSGLISVSEQIKKNLTIYHRPILKILSYPDPRLRIAADPVEIFDTELQLLIDDMFETMYQTDGIGLAATQVDHPIQLIVMDVSLNQNDPLVFINPKVSIVGNDVKPFTEGCLSVSLNPHTIYRPSRVKIDALDRNGNPFTIEDDGLIAVCIQHEIDHMNGNLFIDHLTQGQREHILLNSSCH